MRVREAVWPITYLNPDLAQTMLPDGKETELGTQLGFTWMEKRSLADGTLLWSQGLNVGPGWEEATDVATDARGEYVVGYDTGADDTGERWRIQRHDPNTGDLVWEQLGASAGAAKGVAIDATGLYVVGHRPANSRGWRAWTMMKLDLAEGLLPISIVADSLP